MRLFLVWRMRGRSCRGSEKIKKYQLFINILLATICIFLELVSGTKHLCNYQIPQIVHIISRHVFTELV